MEFLLEAMAQPTSTIALASAFCSVGIFAVSYTLRNQILVVLLYPMSISASLCVSKLFVDFHFYPHRSFDKWVLFTIFSATIGVGLALTAYLILTRLFELMRPQPKSVKLYELRMLRVQLSAARRN